MTVGRQIRKGKWFYLSLLFCFATLSVVLGLFDLVIRIGLIIMDSRGFDHLTVACWLGRGLVTEIWKSSAYLPMGGVGFRCVTMIGF